MRVLAGFMLLFCLPAAAVEDAAEIYATQCAACHSPEALGNAATMSPRLAGQNAAYLQEQTLAFQQGTRGSHPDDVQGQTMRALVSHLSVVQIEALSDYLASRTSPAVTRPNEADGPGAALYAGHCAICHGQYGQGAESIFAPNLQILSAWYLDAQMTAYGHGWRGGDTATTRAKNMRAIRAQIPGQEQTSAIVEHIAGSR